MPASIVGIIIVGAWICLSLAIGYVFSGIVLHSRRQPIVRTPGEYGLDFESVEFKATDGVLLQGWYIPAGKLPFTAEPKQVVILTHPMTFNRHGFVVENQGFPPIAKTAVDLLKMIGLGMCAK